MIFQRQFIVPSEKRVITRASLYWFLLTMAIATGLHWDRLPLWLIALVACLLGWRLYLSQAGARLLPLWLKTGLALASLGLFVWMNGRSFTIETAIGFFVMTYGLKLLELQSDRDAFLFACLSIFLIALTFLFGQDLLNVVLVSGSLLLPLQGLKTLQQSPGASQAVWPGLLQTGKMVLLALPLLLVFYLLFPRMGPLWSMPLKTRTGFTGLSDSMMPGEIAELANSSEQAFRAVFKGEQPRPVDLYWRALILDHYDGTTWTRSLFQQNRDRDIQAGYRQEDVWRYEILMAPHNHLWGYSLAGFTVSLGEAAMTGDQLVRFPYPVKAAKRYRQAPIPPVEQHLDARTRWRLVQVPANSNPVTRTWVAELQAQVEGERALIQRMLSFFRSEPFFYTLKPPLLKSRDRVDEFLFNTRKGFCEHFASSLAVALRIAGIPTRIMTGYQGGEWNEAGQFWSVRQYDAHAWVEAWIEEEGWMPVDPTAAVAPQRVEAGIREALMDNEEFLLSEPMSLARLSRIGVVNWLRLKLEYANYLWQDWVVNYDRGSQSALFSRWLGRDDLTRAAGMLAGLAVTVFLAMAFVSFWPRRHRRRMTPVERQIRRLERKLQQAGLVFESGRYTLRQLEEKASHRWPVKADEMVLLIRDLENVLYADVKDPQVLSRRVSRVRQQISALKLKES